MQTVDWPDKERRKSLEAACLRYQDQLGEEGAAYLRGRALNPGDVARIFRIGRVVEPAAPEHAKYRGRLVLPVLKEGSPVQLLFRCIRTECKVNLFDDEGNSLEDHGEHPKVLGPKGEHRWLFNTDALMDPSSDELDLVEGEWDPIALTDSLGLLAVGIPGAKRWKPSRSVWRRLVRDFRTVRFWKDPDEAGSELYEAIKKDVPHLRLVEPPYDVNKTLQREGAGALMEVAGL